jgi:hypothetical protein
LWHRAAYGGRPNRNYSESLIVVVVESARKPWSSGSFGGKPNNESLIIASSKLSSILLAS